MKPNELWTTERLDTIVSWVEAAYPEEGCGLVLRDAQGQVSVLCCENMANKYHAVDPETYPRTARDFYMVNPMEFVRAQRRGDEIVAVFHSHPDVGDYFSAEDAAGATLPRLSPQEPLQPAYPGTGYLVVSVRQGRADHATLFEFDGEGEEFRGVMGIGIKGGKYELEEGK